MLKIGLADEITKQLYIACHMYIMVMYMKQFLKVKVDDIFNKRSNLLFKLKYKEQFVQFFSSGIKCNMTLLLSAYCTSR